MSIEVVSPTMTLTSDRSSDRKFTDHAIDIDHRDHVRNHSDTFTVLAVESDQCFSFHRTVAQIRSLKNRNVLVYELEEELPVDGEDLAVDRIESKIGSLIVVASGSELDSAIHQIETQGVHVTSITPIIFLAFSRLAKERPVRDLDFLVWQSKSGVDIVRLTRGIPIQWLWTVGQSDLIAATLKSILGTASRPSVLVISGSDDVAETLADFCVVDAIQMNRDQVAAEECAQIIRGTAKPLIDLRNGPLRSGDPHRPIKYALRTFLAMILLLQLCVVGGLLYRSWLYQREASGLIAVQEEAYRKVFPNGSVPIGLVTHLQSEHRRLSATRGVSDQFVPKLQSAIPIAHSFLSAIPSSTETRFEIERIEFVPGKVAIATGVAKTYGDLEAIADSLRGVGFDVPPVSASKTATGVTLRFENIGTSKQVTVR